MLKVPLNNPNSFSPSCIGWTFHSVVSINVGVTLHRCLQNKASQYLMDCCTRTSDVSSRQRLRSASHHQLMVPRHRRSTFGHWAFSVAGPMECNSLPCTHSGTLLGVPTASDRRGKLIFLRRIWTSSALEALRDAIYKLTTITTITTTATTAVPDPDPNCSELSLLSLVLSSSTMLLR